MNLRFSSTLEQGLPLIRSLFRDPVNVLKSIMSISSITNVIGLQIGNGRVLRELLEAFSVVQWPDSIVGFDFWKPDIQTYPVFIRLQKYVAEKFGYKETHYNLFDLDFIESISDYQVEGITTVIEQEKIYTKTCILQNCEKVLPESYGI